MTPCVHDFSLSSLRESPRCLFSIARRCSPAAAAGAAVDAQAGDAEVAGFRMAAEAFLAAEVMFREVAAVSREVTGVFPAVAAVSLEVAVFLAVAEVVCPGPAAVFLAVVAPAIRGAVVIFPVEATAVPLDRTASRTILHCSPIWADRGRVAVECHRAQPEVNQAAIVH